MIALPAFVQKNGAIFAAGMLIGAMAAWGPAACVGKGQANQRAALINQATAAKNIATAERMDKAAALTELSLAVKNQTDIKELREIITDDATDDAVGAGMQSVLERVRRRATAAR